MKFNFKIQEYQTEAVDAVVKVFNGQGYHDKISYIRDKGKLKGQQTQLTLAFEDEFGENLDILDDTGYKNEVVELSDEQLLKNIHDLQSQNNIKLSSPAAVYVRPHPCGGSSRRRLLRLCYLYRPHRRVYGGQGCLRRDR